MANTPTIFLSYSWANTNIADEIDKVFEITGINLKRDVKHLKYKGNIKDFMKAITNHDFVVVLISNEFIKSPNCMYEIMELLNDGQYKEKILPVLLDGTKIFNTKDRVEIIKYWNGKKEEALNLLREVNPTEAISVQDDLKHYTNICANIDVFLSHITYTNCKGYEELKKEGYKPIFELIGYDPQDAEKIKRLIIIKDIKDEEDQDLELGKYLLQYPNDPQGWFTKGFICSKRKKYKLSKHAYEIALEINPLNGQAHNNYGLLLIENFGDKDGAKEHYEKSLSINPEHAYPHYNYANLLNLQFNDKDRARFHYEKALAIDPEYAKAHNNYAQLLIRYFGDKEGAKEHYEKALSINPEYAAAHCNYALLLKNHFEDKSGAKEHYEKALSINPEFALVHSNYAVLLKVNFNETEKAKEHYLRAVELESKQKTPERDNFFGV